MGRPWWTVFSESRDASNGHTNRRVLRNEGVSVLVNKVDLIVNLMAEDTPIEKVAALVVKRRVNTRAQHFDTIH